MPLFAVLLRYRRVCLMCCICCSVGACVWWESRTDAKEIYARVKLAMYRRSATIDLNHSLDSCAREGGVRSKLARFGSREVPGLPLDRSAVSSAFAISMGWAACIDPVP